MNNTTTVLYHDIRKPKKDGTAPILVRIILDGESAGVRTGVYIQPKDWNPKERKIKPSYRGTQSVARLNEFLQKQQTLVSDFIKQLDEEEKLDGLTPIQIKDLFLNRSKSHSFYDYATTVIRDLKKSKRFGTARAHEGVIQVLKKFHGEEKDLSFTQITSDSLKKMEIEHLAKGYKLNGLAAYLRSIRSLYNAGIKAGLVKEKFYPFKKYHIKTTEPRKRALPMQFFMKIVEKQLPEEHPLFHTRNYFLASYYLRGMNFVDLADLRARDIIDGNRIYYDRNKTKKPFNILIVPELQAILDYYLDGKAPEDFIFPIVKREKPDEQYKDVLWAYYRYNKKLKKLAELCGISKNITSYVARHTFGTNAKNLGIDAAAVQDLFGHKNLKTTQAYMDGLQSDLMDDLQKKILKGKSERLPSEADSGSAEAHPEKE